MEKRVGDSHSVVREVSKQQHGRNGRADELESVREKHAQALASVQKSQEGKKATLF